MTLTGISCPRRKIWLCGSLRFSTVTREPKLRRKQEAESRKQESGVRNQTAHS
jgi:hypothetical protein